MILDSKFHHLAIKMPQQKFKTSLLLTEMVHHSGYATYSISLLVYIIQKMNLKIEGRNTVN